MNVSTTSSYSKKHLLWIESGVNQGSTIVERKDRWRENEEKIGRKQPIWRQVGTKTVRRWNNAKERVSARFKLAGTNEQMECAPAERKNKEEGRGRKRRKTWERDEKLYHFGLVVFEGRSRGWFGDYRRYSLIRPGYMPPNRRFNDQIHRSADPF